MSRPDRPIAGTSGPIALDRDEHGVAIVEARSVVDALRGLGYCHARDRGLQMLFVRILGRGQGSRWFESTDRMLVLTQGGVQWTNTGVLSTIVEMAKGNDSFYWFANVDDSPGAEGLVVQPGINGIKDLKGKKIAVTLNSGAEITLYYLLKEAGLALGDVRVVPMASNEMVAAFANKSIDVA